MSTLNTLRDSLSQLTNEELKTLKKEIESRLSQSVIGWVDTECHEEAKKMKDESITLESIRESFSKINGSMSDIIISSREDRF